MPKFCFALSILLIFIEFSVPAQAAEVIANQSVPNATLSKAQLQAIYSMQKRYWPGQRPIKVFTLPDTSNTHKTFVKQTLGMFVHQIRRIWDRMTFSGTGVPPIQLSSEEEMIKTIANTPDSIGYLAAKPKHENIRNIPIE